MTTRSPTSFSSQRRSAFGLVVALFLIFVTQECNGAYYGKLIGKLSELHHGVSGEVYAVDGRTLFIKDFTYDGEGPAAFFYVGNGKSPNGNGFRVRDEHGTENVLKRYRKKDITLTLPDGKTLNNIKWFYVWCDEFSVNFGDVRIARGFDYPKPQKIGTLSGIHGVSSEPIVIVDAQTLLIPGFSYDGEAPDAKFWAGPGPNPSPQGIRIPDENGKEQPLRRYDRKTIVLTLPGDLTVHQLGHFGVWCEAFAVDFAHVKIPQSMTVPPSLKMLGVSPQSKLNCEVLEDRLGLEVRWAVAGDSIVVQLVGKLEAGQYMGFGISANTERSLMVGGDIVVAWVDKETLQGYAVDYLLDAKSQCSGGRGSCPDNRIRENTDSVRLLNAAMVNGYSIVTYQRPLKASDELDLPIQTNGSQAIIWAVGPLNERLEVSFHSDYLKTDRFIEFGRPPAWNCPMPDQDQPHSSGDNVERETVNRELIATTRRPQRVPATPAPAPKGVVPWEIPPIQCYEPQDGVFYAQMGPTGGKHGYPAITGHVGWGISWYINGLLIPEINVVRGKTYTFVVEGGNNPDTPARYHPFYITDDPVGGYQHKTPEEKAKVKIFAGVRRQRGTIRPIGVGRLCNWVPDQNQPLADEFPSFGAYQRTLSLECDENSEAGFVQWTPDENTPDTVYYQCFTHRYLGWKINVHDTCDVAEPQASENHEVYVEPNPDFLDSTADLEGSSSISTSSKVTPTAEFLQQHLHHPHRGEYGLRYPHHSTTNPGKLSTSHTQLLTNSHNNNYVRLQSSYEDPYGQGSAYVTPVYATVPPHRHEDQQRQTTRQQQQQQSPVYHEQQSNGGTRPSTGIDAYSYSSSNAQLPEINQEIQQPSNQQLSNLVPDNPRPVSHTVKHVYPSSGTQIVYSKVPHHYPTNHHHLHQVLQHYLHHHQPEQRTQLMIVRRPVLMRRPILQNAATILTPTLTLPPRPVFVERKKAVHYINKTPILATAKGTTDRTWSSHSSSNSRPAVKQTKPDMKQRARLEAKVSDTGLLDGPYEGSSRLPSKPARNTGFDPGSIVIEGGFKPIIRTIEPEKNVVAEKRFFQRDKEFEEERLEKSTKENSSYFEPVFVPSPPMSASAERIRKQKKKSTKPRLDELVDDMEMAADRLDAYYLPPAAGKSSRVEDRPGSTGILIAYDGKRLKDTGLARSIAKIEDRSRSGLSSDVLSRTPQFGRFKGDLPPPIPISIRQSEDTRFDGGRRLSSDLSQPDILAPGAPKNTRLTLVGRTKRSPHDTQKMSIDRKNDHHGDHHDHQGHQNTSTLVSAGQLLLANFEYVILTAILYFVI